MSTSVERKPTPEQPHASELRPEALQAVETLHETIKSWAPGSEYTLTESAAEFPVRLVESGPAGGGGMSGSTLCAMTQPVLRNTMPPPNHI